MTYCNTIVETFSPPRCGFFLEEDLDVQYAAGVSGFAAMM
jgi:hypothetical protein